MTSRISVVLSGALIVSLSGGLAAHHAPAVFDQSREVVLEGVVTEFRWSNPHSWILMDVEDDDGMTRNWSIEMNPPTYLVRGGWRSNSVKAGDRVSVTVNPLKANDQPAGKFVAIVLPDGSILGEQEAVLGEGD